MKNIHCYIACPKAVKLSVLHLESIRGVYSIIEDALVVFAVLYLEYFILHIDCSNTVEFYLTSVVLHLGIIIF